MESIFKRLSEKGYRAALSHTIEGLDELHLSHPIKTAEIALVVEWLRVHYDIWINVFADDNHTFKYEITKWSWYEIEKTHRVSHTVLGDSFWDTSSEPFESPQEAYITAIDYVLKNLI